MDATSSRSLNSWWWPVGHSSGKLCASMARRQRSSWSCLELEWLKPKAFILQSYFFQFRRWSWIVCANMLALFISDTLKKLYAGSHKNGWKVKAINARWRCSTPGNLNALLSAHVRLSGANKTDVFQLNSCVCSYMPWMQLCDDRKSLFVSMGAEMRSYQLPQQLRRCGRSTLKFQTKYLPLQGKDLYRFRFKGDLFIGGGW